MHRQLSHGHGYAPEPGPEWGLRAPELGERLHRIGPGRQLDGSNDRVLGPILPGARTASRDQPLGFRGHQRAHRTLRGPPETDSGRLPPVHVRHAAGHQAERRQPRGRDERRYAAHPRRADPEGVRRAADGRHQARSRASTIASARRCSPPKVARYTTRRRMP